MSATPIDADAVKAEQRRSWDTVSGGWAQEWQTFERGGAGITARLLDTARVGRGQRVLDLATGPGEPALSAAERVGAEGSVFGVDLSPAMVALAESRAAGRPNVRFAVADLESAAAPRGEFDVVLSRFGLMFAVDRVAALRQVTAALTPGGVLAAAVWASPDRAPVLSVGYRVLAEMLDLPAAPPGAPGPYTMADPARVLLDLAQAGLADGTVTEHVAAFTFDSAGHYARFTRAVAPPPVQARLAALPNQRARDEVWAAVADAARGHRHGAAEVRMASHIWIVRAVAPDGPQEDARTADRRQ